MSALIVALLLSADPACFVPRDTTPGWKQVTLPPEAPALAAPAGFEQFRSDQPVEVIDDHPGVHLAGSGYYKHGRTDFTLKPGKGTCAVQLDFREGLRGAKVDVTAWGPNGSMSLVSEQRVAGSRLDVRWGDPGVFELYVTVHDHLRDAPVLASWKSTCTVNAAELPVSDAYKLGRSLYYLQPGSQAVPLCNKPEVQMQVRSARLPGSSLPTAVVVRRD